MIRHKKSSPCAVCGGHPDAPRGEGVRCAGWVSDDGEWVHCMREEVAGNAKFHSGSGTYSHRARGRCPCGEVHGDPLPGEEERGRYGDRRGAPPPARRSAPAPAPAPAPRSRPPAEVRQIGDTDRAPIVATYDYKALDGSLLYQVCRTEPKSFRQRRPDGRGGWIWNMQGQPTTLYRIPELFAGLEAGDSVWVAEGEKDVDALFAAGCVATCNTGGAGKWRPELAAPFARAQAGARVVVVQDRDDPGREHARKVHASISEAVPAGVEVVIVEAAVGKDAADHLEAKRGVEEFVQVWPPPADLLERDPAAFKRFMLSHALEQPASVLERIPIEHVRERHPFVPVGLVPASSLLHHLVGATVLSGAPSAGKSYLAISTAVDAVFAGWDVFYASCEMHEDLIFDRAARAAASAGVNEGRLLDNFYRAELMARARTVRLPDSFHYLHVGIGVRMADILAYLVENVSARPTLVVFDSLSSFIDNLAEERGSDTFKMRDLREVIRWVVAARRLTHGHVSFLLLSELNKEGRAKGRFVDHRCDMAIAMESSKDNGAVKHVSVTKSWWGPIGRVGDYLLDWELARLRSVPS